MTVSPTATDRRAAAVHTNPLAAIPPLICGTIRRRDCHLMAYPHCTFTRCFARDKQVVHPQNDSLADGYAARALRGRRVTGVSSQPLSDVESGGAFLIHDYHPCWQ